MTKNEITGASLVTKPSSEAYREGWDSIFAKDAGSDNEGKTLKTCLPKFYSEEQLLAMTEEHKKLILLRNSGYCSLCKDRIVSNHQHDFIQCSCGASFIDGGLAYHRSGGRLVDTSIYTDEDDIENIREFFTWKSYGPNGDQPVRYLLLKDMELNHIEAILRTQYHIRGTHVEGFFKMEMKYRKDNNL